VVTETVGALVTRRPCVYERRVWNGEGEVWELADRRAVDRYDWWRGDGKRAK
jgi:hypothetical protein